MSAHDSVSDQRRRLVCVGLYVTWVTIWWLLVLLNQSGRCAWLWSPLRALMFGQAVLVDHLLPFSLPRIAGPVTWLAVELAAATGLAFLFQGLMRKWRGPCWLGALIGAGVIQVGLYGLGVFVGE